MSSHSWLPDAQERLEQTSEWKMTREQLKRFLLAQLKRDGHVSFSGLDVQHRQRLTDILEAYAMHLPNHSSLVERVRAETYSAVDAALKTSFEHAVEKRRDSETTDTFIHRLRAGIMDGVLSTALRSSLSATARRQMLQPSFEHSKTMSLSAEVMWGVWQSILDAPTLTPEKQLALTPVNSDLKSAVLQEFHALLRGSDQHAPLVLRSVELSRGSEHQWLSTALSMAAQDVDNTAHSRSEELQQRTTLKNVHCVLCLAIPFSLAFLNGRQSHFPPSALETAQTCMLFSRLSGKWQSHVPLYYDALRLRFLRQVLAELERRYPAVHADYERALHLPDRASTGHSMGANAGAQRVGPIHSDDAVAQVDVDSKQRALTELKSNDGKSDESEMFVSEDEAAVRIQAVFRGHRARRMHGVFSGHREATQALFARQAAAALVVQRVVRGFLVRKSLAASRRRESLAAPKPQDRQQAARLIQISYRSHRDSVHRTSNWHIWQAAKWLAAHVESCFLHLLPLPTITQILDICIQSDFGLLIPLCATLLVLVKERLISGLNQEHEKASKSANKLDGHMLSKLVGMQQFTPDNFRALLFNRQGLQQPESMPRGPSPAASLDVSHHRRADHADVDSTESPPGALDPGAAEPSADEAALRSDPDPSSHFDASDPAADSASDSSEEMVALVTMERVVTDDDSDTTSNVSETSMTSL